MGELTIRRNRGFTPPQYQGVSKAGKTASAGQSKGVQRTTVTLSQTLQQRISGGGQSAAQARQSRRTLQAGEGTLAEVKDSLGRMAQLAEEAANGAHPDREAIQAELEALAKDVDRMLRSASAGDTPLFLEGDGGEAGAKALLSVLAGETQETADQSLPGWLIRGLSQQAVTSEQLLEALGLDSSASGPELVAALTNLSLDSDAASRLATLYLGAVISGGSDMESALAGLEQLLEKVAQGTSLDEAIAQLTNGLFDGLADFQAQFTSGTAPGLGQFLADLLLNQTPQFSLGAAPYLSLLEGMKGMNLELLMGLLTTQGGEGAQEALAPAQSGGQAAETGAAASSQAPMTVVELGKVFVMGRDLSGVSFDQATGLLTLAGDQDVTVFGQGEGEQAIVLAGSGRVNLEQVTVSSLTVTAPLAQINSLGESVIQELTLDKGSLLTLDGRGLLRIGLLRAQAEAGLRLTGGAVILSEGEREDARGQVLPVEVDGAASLVFPAASRLAVQGKEPFDLLWKTLLPGWSSLTSVEADGKLARMLLPNGEHGRLWLSKWEHSAAARTLLFRGRDRQGRAQTRYAYLVWNQTARAFEEMSMYPNPFAVEGGEPGTDWVYEEESHTLHILSGQVTAVAGGSGTDANQVPFSGRIVLADKIGAIRLELGGVACRVSAGRAFDLGCSNQVTLMLQSGTRNFFESGAGCAGISLGEGTSLCVDSPGGADQGALTASGGAGGAGIGRDSGTVRDRSSHILIRGGTVTAAGAGGGAGIGAGKGSAFGGITILGGNVTSTGGEEGGAGIGGALGAEAGDISVQGGRITALAAFHAAAIGAGVQGACGDIVITGTARVVKAAGGDPGADIGPCLFGSCGQVSISGGADIGGAGLGAPSGIHLQMGEDTVTLPQFRLSAAGMQLDKVNVSTQAWSKEAQMTIEAGRQWVARIQGVYRAMYGRLSGQAVRGVQQYIDAAEESAASRAEALLQTISRQSAQAVRTHSPQGGTDGRGLLQ